MSRSDAELAAKLLRQPSMGSQEAYWGGGLTFAVDQVLGLVGLIKHLQRACKSLSNPAQMTCMMSVKLAPASTFTSIADGRCNACILICGASESLLHASIMQQ